MTSPELVAAGVPDRLASSLASEQARLSYAWDRTQKALAAEQRRTEELRNALQEANRDLGIWQTDAANLHIERDRLKELVSVQSAAVTDAKARAERAERAKEQQRQQFAASMQELEGLKERLARIQSAFAIAAKDLL